MKKLITTAHDFGLTQSVNDGIIYALNHKNNIFSEISLLVNTPGSESAAGYIKAHPELSCNLSFCLTRFKPLLQSHKTLIDKQGFLKKVDTGNWDFSAIDSYDPIEVEAELEAQYQWFIKHVGRKPSALTSQKSEHGDPKILIPFIKIAKREGLPIRAPFWRWKTNYGAQIYAEDEGLKFPGQSFVMTHDWKAQFGIDIEHDLDNLIAEIHNSPYEISELMFVCGFVDVELFSVTSLNWQRGQLLNVMERKPEIIERIKKEFEIISYQDL